MKLLHVHVVAAHADVTWMAMPGAESYGWMDRWIDRSSWMVVIHARYEPVNSIVTFCATPIIQHPFNASANEIFLEFLNDVI